MSWIPVRVKYHSDIDPIEINPKGDWVDLRCAEDVELKKGETKLISLGVSMQLPDGYEAHLVVRSSTPKKWGIVQLNVPGVIDNSYCGNNDIWYLQVMAIRDTFIPKNTRIAQFRIFYKQPQLKFIPVEDLGNEDRGGFGSTGTA